jgi:hypothetical protein
MKTLKESDRLHRKAPPKPKEPQTSAKLLRYLQTGVITTTRLEAVRDSLRLPVSLSARVTKERER